MYFMSPKLQLQFSSDRGNTSRFEGKKQESVMLTPYCSARYTACHTAQSPCGYLNLCMVSVNLLFIINCRGVFLKRNRISAYAYVGVYGKGGEGSYR